MSHKKTAATKTTSAATARRAPSTRKKRKVVPFDASSDDEAKAMVVLADVASSEEADEENEKKNNADADFRDAADASVDNGADDDDATAPDSGPPVLPPVRSSASLKKTKSSAPVVVDFSSVPSSVALQRAFDLEVLDARAGDAYTNLLHLLVAEPRDLFALAEALTQTKRTARVMLRELVNIECVASSMDDAFAGAVLQISLIGRAALAKRQQLVQARKSIVRVPEVELCGYSTCKNKALSRYRCSGCHAVVFCNDRCLDDSNHSFHCLQDSGDPRRRFGDQLTVVNLALPIPEPVVVARPRGTRGRGGARGAAARARAQGRPAMRGRGRGGRGRGSAAALRMSDAVVFMMMGRDRDDDEAMPYGFYDDDSDPY